MELHAITDDSKPVEELARIIITIQNEVDFIHIRERSKSAADILKLLELIFEGGIDKRKLVMNGRVDIALFSTIHRVQLPSGSFSPKQVRARFPHLHIGRSVHSLEEAVQAERKTRTTCCSAMCLKRIAKRVLKAEEYLCCQISNSGFPSRL